MKKQINMMINAAFPALLVAALTLPASAQKLKEVQETGFWAPANTKVDAKLTEWGDTFQAFNKTTNTYYTVANDDTNLYLVLKSSDPAVNNKIIGGGINFTINTSNKKSAKDAFVIVFPQIDPQTLRGQVMSFRGGMGGGGAPGGAVMTRTVTVDHADVATSKTGVAASGNGPDSAAIAGMRKKAVANFKEMKLIGFKDIPDSVISVYNEYGLKGLVDFDDKGSLIMEMCIPLKYMNLKPGSAETFAYNIKLNGINLDAIFPGASAMMNSMMSGGGMPGGFGGGGGMGGGGDRVVVVAGSPGGMGGGGMGIPRGMADMAGMLNPTDFWGKYTLAKKTN